MSSNSFSIPFFINSKDRVSGQINNADFIFKDSFSNDKEYSVLLKEFQIKNDFYNINQFNNSFVLGVLSSSSITIP